ncbi:MAG: hypothetical protein ACXVDA_14405 [Ktedonobacterales bacterium]
MSRFEQGVRQRLHNPEVAAGHAEQLRVAHETLSDARPNVPRIIHMNWRRWAFLPLSIIIFLPCMAAITSILTPGTSWLGVTFAFLLGLGLLVLPIFVLWSITIELTVDRIRQRDIPFAVRDMPYSAIQCITIDQRTIIVKGVRHVYFLVIHDEEGAKMQIDMVQFRHEDLRTIVNSIVAHAPHARLDANTRAFQAGQFVFRY